MIAKHRKSVILTRLPRTGISWTYSDAEPRLSFFRTTYLLNIPLNPTNDPPRPQGQSRAKNQEIKTEFCANCTSVI